MSCRKGWLGKLVQRKCQVKSVTNGLVPNCWQLMPSFCMCTNTDGLFSWISRSEMYTIIIMPSP